MLPDSECIKLICEILDKINLGSYQVKVNHRKLLNGIFEICGVPEAKIRTVSSSLDKLDKVSDENIF